MKEDGVDLRDIPSLSPPAVYQSYGDKDGMDLNEQDGREVDGGLDLAPAGQAALVSPVRPRRPPTTMIAPPQPKRPASPGTRAQAIELRSSSPVRSPSASPAPKKKRKVSDQQPNDLLQQLDELDDEVVATSSPSKPHRRPADPPPSRSGFRPAARPVQGTGSAFSVPPPHAAPVMVHPRDRPSNPPATPRSPSRRGPALPSSIPVSPVRPAPSRIQPHND